MKLCHLLLLALPICTLPALSFALEDSYASVALNISSSRLIIRHLAW